MEYSVGAPCQFWDFIIWNIIWNSIMLDYHANTWIFIIWNNPCALYMEYLGILGFYNME